MSSNNRSDFDPNLYSGRWVALIKGKIIAQGGTPQQVLRAAQKSRYKEKPEIQFMKGLEVLNFSPLFETIRDILADEDDVFLVGGAVRDAILQREIHDLDFAVKKNAIKLARKVAHFLNADFYPLDLDRDTGRVLVTADNGKRHFIDFAAFRGVDLESDLKSRDFTINAMAIDLKDLSLHDPVAGMVDLREKCIRACSQSSFQDDPIRIFRAVRLSAAFGFQIFPQTTKLMKTAVKLLQNVSSERQRDELFRILEGPKPAICIKALDILGALEQVLPEMMNLKGIAQASPHVHDVWFHTLSVVSHLETILAALDEQYNPEIVSDYFHGVLVLKIGRYRKQISEHLSNLNNLNRSWREILFLSALYHDISKPEKSVTGENGHVRFWGHEEEGAVTICQRAGKLALSNEEIDRLRIIIKNHMRIHFHTKRYMDENVLPSRRAIFRFYRDVGKAGVDICLLTLADLWATYDHSLPEDTWLACLEVVKVFLESWWFNKEELITPPPLISGDEIMELLSLEAGPEVGYLLEAVREAQAVKDVKNKEEALNYACEYRTKLQKGDLKEFVLLNNTKLAFFQRPGNGIPVILIHGYPLDHTIWQHMIPHLNKDARLIMPDLRGFGQSSTTEEDYSMERIADDIAGLLDYLRIKKSVLIGHSMGGYVSLAFAHKYEKRVMGLGLVASRVDADTSTQKLARANMIKDIQERGMNHVAEYMSSRLVKKPDLTEDIRLLINKIQPEGAIGALKAMIDRDDFSNLFGNLKIPTLAIAGMEDALIPLEKSRSIKELNPNCIYQEFDKVGHMPMIESPQRAAEAINLLIQQIGS